MKVHHTHHHEKQGALSWLVETFPKAFFTNAQQVKPLKIGIFEDILEFYDRLTMPPFSKKTLREAINYYSSSKAYLISQTQNSMRIDLFGFEAEPISSEQVKYAEQRLAERQNTKKDSVTDKH